MYFGVQNPGKMRRVRKAFHATEAQIQSSRSNFTTSAEAVICFASLSVSGCGTSMSYSSLVFRGPPRVVRRVYSRQRNGCYLLPQDFLAGVAASSVSEFSTLSCSFLDLRFRATSSRRKLLAIRLESRRREQRLRTRRALRLSRAATLPTEALLLGLLGADELVPSILASFLGSALDVYEIPVNSSFLWLHLRDDLQKQARLLQRLICLVC